MASLAKNIGLSLFTFLSRIVSGSVIYIILARLMSLEDFGLLSFGVSLAGLLSVIAEFGFSLMAQRDIPQDRFSFSDYVINTLIQKVGFSILSLIGGLVYLLLLYSGNNLTIGIIFVVNAIITSNTTYFFAIFRAKNMFKIESWLALFYTASLIILVIIYYLFKLDVLFIAYGLLLVRFLQLIVLTSIYGSKFKFKIQINKEIQRYLFINSFSFGAHYIIGIFYLLIDTQLIAYYVGNEALALYSAFFKIILLLLIFTDLFNNVFLPYLAKLFPKDLFKFKMEALLINKAIASIGILLFVFINLFSNDIVTLLYSEKYSASISLTIPLSFVLLFRVFSVVYAVLLTISNHQNIRVLIVFVTLVVNLILNFFIIPEFGYVGASYVSMFTHFVLFTLYFVFTIKYFNTILVDLRLILFAVSSILFVLFREFILDENYFIINVLYMFACSGFLFISFKRNQINKLKYILLNKNI